jgi:predicted  nucleic acid-binding Zn-ribbon protein
MQIWTKRKSDTNQDIKELHSRITNTSRELNEKLEDAEDKIMSEIKRNAQRNQSS